MFFNKQETIILKKIGALIFIGISLYCLILFSYQPWKEKQVFSDFNENAMYINKIEFQFILKGEYEYGYRNYEVKHSDLDLIKKTFVNAEPLSRGRVGVYTSHGRGMLETSNGKIYQFDVDFDNINKDTNFFRVSGIDGFYANLEYIDTEHIWLNYVTSHGPENDDNEAVETDTF